MWIKNRLPDESKGEFGELLIKTQSGKIKVACYDDTRNVWVDENGSYLTTDEVKEWQRILEDIDERECE